MRHKPKLSYSGLTIVLSNPSRRDKDARQLLAGYAGDWFDTKCLQPLANRHQCDIRTSDTQSQGLLPGTDSILLLGDRAFAEWTNKEYSLYTLHEQRGNLLNTPYKDISVMASYLPQDCVDPKNYEKFLNKDSNFTDAELPPSDDFDKGHRAGTARSNYKFWLAQDVRKLLCAQKSPHRHSKVLLFLEKYPGSVCCSMLPHNRSGDGAYRLYPKSGEAIEALSTTKDEQLYLDIETDSELNMRCFAFGFSSGPIFVVPCIRYDYTVAYHDIASIMRALAIAMRDNTVICHNALFDLFVLAWKYRLPIGPKIYDTMLAQHRCFPKVEKSLGHCTSLWTWEPYHKDEGIYDPKNADQEMKLWQYNGKDVYTMRLIRQQIDNYAVHRRGLKESIAQVNKSVRPYLISTLQGIRVSAKAANELMEHNDRLMNQLLRCLRILTGQELLPTSPKQCVDYFHKRLGYTIIKRTKSGASLDEESMRKLKLRHKDNPVIDLCLQYRGLKKESGKLKFEPWVLR